MARPVPEIPNASMADIAFMLLIFFLVATTMDMDIGISRKLPPMPDKETEPEKQQVNKRNIFVVLINKNDKMLVNNNYMNIDNLKEKTIEFITNPADDPDLSEKQSLSELKQVALEKGDSRLANNIQKAIDIIGDYKRSKGVVSLQNDRGTSYKMYIKVQNELVAAFNELRDRLAMEKFGKRYDQLENDQQEAIQIAIPQAISEAEPKNVR
ncbi:MAG: biopolymer transporter ExbD [Marinilabiliales bacterium]